MKIPFPNIIAIPFLRRRTRSGPVAIYQPFKPVVTFIVRPSTFASAPTDTHITSGRMSGYKNGSNGKSRRHISSGGCPAAVADNL
ncbi:MAG: hypothetical protein PHD74_03005 [Candidatus Krumholzibacteria bacterium]|nr:hypothetical protein [Candidatus Krumholzibacteria bacterium]